jgi:uncharacterized protein (TIGR00369 family)
MMTSRADDTGPSIDEIVATTGGPFAATLGIELVEASKGHCVMRMTVRPDMLNGAGVAHGAVVFALADTASGAAAWTHRFGALAQSATC